MIGVKGDTGSSDSSSYHDGPAFLVEPWYRVLKINLGTILETM